MGMKKIYRYENAHGIGPYSASSGCDELERMLYEHSDDEHPVADWSRLRNSLGTIKCGCTSKRALSQWFKGYGKALVRAGFKRVVYHVHKDDVGFRDHVGQVAFIAPTRTGTPC